MTLRSHSAPAVASPSFGPTERSPEEAHAHRRTHDAMFRRRGGLTAEEINALPSREEQLRSLFAMQPQVRFEAHQSTLRVRLDNLKTLAAELGELMDLADPTRDHEADPRALAQALTVAERELEVAVDRLAAQLGLVAV